MLSMLQGWQGGVEMDGVMYQNITEISPIQLINKSIHIKLYPPINKSLNKAGNQEKTAILNTVKQYKITVKQYMTRQASPDFDFMAKWNNNQPMPLRTMQGTVEKETRGMVYMKLHGVGLPEIRCMRCGRELTHPISRHYGIGPECMAKIGIVADIEDVESIKEQLVNVEWEGWIIKSAIIEQDEV